MGIETIEGIYHKRHTAFKKRYEFAFNWFYGVAGRIMGAWKRFAGSWRTFMVGTRYSKHGIIVCLTAQMMLASCKYGSGTEVTDVSAEPRYQGDFVPGTEFQIMNDLLLYANRDSTFTSLVPGETTFWEDANGTKTEAPLIDMYRKDPKRWPHIAGLLAGGAKVRVDKLVRYTTTTFSRLSIYATVLDGEHAGKTVDLDRAATPSGNGTSRVADESFLKRLK